MLQHVAVRCSLLQCVALCCSSCSTCMKPWHVSVTRVAVHDRALQCVAVCCSVLQFELHRVAAQCSVLLRVTLALPCLTCIKP